MTASILFNNGNGIAFTGAASSDSPIKFSVLGGRYGVAANATWGGGSLQLNILMPDGTTYINALVAFTADGAAVVDLPAGSYEFVIVTAIAVQAFITPIPYRPAA